MRKLEGSVTIYVTILFTVIVTIVVTEIYMCRISGSIAYIDMASDLSVDAVFSDFDRDLFEMYGLLGIDATDEEIKSLYEDMMLDNLSETPGFFKMGIDKVNFGRGIRMSDYDGALFERQVVDYAKYYVPVDYAKQMIEMMLGVQNGNDLNKVFEDIAKVQSLSGKIDEKFYQLISLVDGPEVKNMDVCDEYGMICANDYFVKRFAKASQDNVSMGFTSLDAYNGVNYRFLSVEAMLERLILNYKNDDEKFNKEFKELVKESEIAHKKINEAKDVCEEILELCEEMTKKSKSCIKTLENLKDVLPKDSYEGLMDSLIALCDNHLYKNNKVCDIENVLKELKSTKEKVVEIELCIDFDLEETEEEKIKENLVNALGFIREIDYSNLIFDYSRIHVFGDEGSGSFYNFKSIFSLSILDYVMGDKKISNKSLPRAYENTKLQYPTTNEDLMLRTITFNEYLLGKFNHAQSKKVAAPLDYEIEYVIYGKMTDKGNLSSAVTNITNIRFLIDFLYILGDTEKVSEATTLSTAILGAFGNPAVVEVGKYIILMGWSYYEALCDVRILMDGQRLEFFKTSKNWRTSIQNIFQKSNPSQAKVYSKTGLCYEDYLRLLLYTANYGKRINGAMNVMEVNIKKNDKDFEIRRLAIGVDMTVDFYYKATKEDKKLSRNVGFIY